MVTAFNHLIIFIKDTIAVLVHDSIICARSLLELESSDIHGLSKIYCQNCRVGLAYIKACRTPVRMPVSTGISVCCRRSYSAACRFSCTFLCIGTGCNIRCLCSRNIIYNRIFYSNIERQRASICKCSCQCCTSCSDCINLIVLCIYRHYTVITGCKCDLV